MLNATEKRCNPYGMSVKSKSSRIHTANIGFAFNDIAFDSNVHMQRSDLIGVCTVYTREKLFAQNSHFSTRILNKHGMCFSAWLRFYLCTTLNCALIS